MKHFIISILILCSFVTGSSAQTGFEGTLTWSMKLPMLGDKETPFVMSAKGDKSVIHMDAGPTGAIDIYSDKASQKTFVVMKAMNMGYEIETPAESAPNDDSKALSPKATGKKEKINGYNCAQYVAELEDGASMELWMTGELNGELLVLMSQSLKNGLRTSGAKSNGLEELIKKGLAPIRTAMFSDGKEQAQMNFVSFEAKKLPDDMFVVPTGINFMKMPAGMGR